MKKLIGFLLCIFLCLIPLYSAPEAVVSFSSKSEQSAWKLYPALVYELLHTICTEEEVLSDYMKSLSLAERYERISRMSDSQIDLMLQGINRKIISASGMQGTIRTQDTYKEVEDNILRAVRMMMEYGIFPLSEIDRSTLEILSRIYPDGIALPPEDGYAFLRDMASRLSAI